MTQGLKPMPGADGLKGLGILFVGIGALWIIGGAMFTASTSQSVSIAHTTPAVVPAPARAKKGSFTVIAPVDGWSDALAVDARNWPHLHFDCEVNMLTSEGKKFVDGPNISGVRIGYPTWLKFQSRTERPATVTVIPAQ